MFSMILFWNEKDEKTGCFMSEDHQFGMEFFMIKAPTQVTYW